MTCRKCKKEIPDGSRYCNRCGATQQPPERSVKKRGNGQGTVVKRGNGYRAIMRIYSPEYRCITRQFKKKSDALAALPDMRAELMGARAKKKGIVTLSLLYAGWSTSSAMKLSNSKQTAYRIAYNRILPVAEAPISELTIDDLQRLVDGLTYYPARDVKTLLSHLYKRACAQQDVASNLAAFIVLPDLDEAEATPFSESELKAMWDAWNDGDRFVGFILTMIYTGMMPGELLGCKKDMIDFDGQKIVGAGKKTKERKSKPIMLPDFLIPVLRKLCAHQHPTVVGMNRDTWYDEYHACLHRIGVRDLKPYSCRHTTATALAIGDKVAPALITKIMRQKRATTTERYKHADEKQVLDGLNTLNPEKIG